MCLELRRSVVRTVRAIPLRLVELRPVKTKWRVLFDLPHADPHSDSAPSEGAALVRYLASCDGRRCDGVVVGGDSQVAITNIFPGVVVPGDPGNHSLRLRPLPQCGDTRALAYNFLLTEPRCTLIVDDPANVWAIGLLFSSD